MSNYPAGIGNYFEQDAEETRQQERRWEIIIEDIGERPFYKIDGYYFGEEQAIEVLNEEFGKDNYQLEEWGVRDDEVYEKHSGGI